MTAFPFRLIISDPLADFSKPTFAAAQALLNNYQKNVTIEDTFTPEQLAAVTLGAEPALILAGAGSGKTKVLTTRIAWLLQTAQVSPGGVMAVTFTNKAAKEMLTRLGAMLPIAVRGMWIGSGAR